MRRMVPWLLIVLRVLGCPLLVVGALRSWAGLALDSIIVAALLSDIYDGVLARRWGCETSGLRLADSLADTVLYLGVVGALWIREPSLIRGNWILFGVLFGLEAARYIFDLWKFHKAASYHSYLAKAWGLLIVLAVIGALSSSRLSPLIRIAVIFGILVNLEGLAMSLLLPRWRNDVKTLGKAWKLRRTMLQEISHEPRL